MATARLLIPRPLFKPASIPVCQGAQLLPFSRWVAISVYLSWLCLSKQFVASRPSPLLKPATSQYSACCAMCWWSICITRLGQHSVLSLSTCSVLCCPVLAVASSLVTLPFPNKHLICFFVICGEQHPFFMLSVTVSHSSTLYWLPISNTTMNACLDWSPRNIFRNIITTLQSYNTIGKTVLTSMELSSHEAWYDHYRWNTDGHAMTEAILHIWSTSEKQYNDNKTNEITSFWLHVFGQNLSNPLTTCKTQSGDISCTLHSSIFGH